jgi:F0F1-type ATP synthase assembly protein I
VTAASPWSYLLLAVVGFVASVLNVLSGGGSFLQHVVTGTVVAFAVLLWFS